MNAISNRAIIKVSDYHSTLQPERSCGLWGWYLEIAQTHGRSGRGVGFVSQVYLHFYAGDWLKDPAVVLLSLSSRAVWFEIILRIHEQQSDGKLIANAEQIARMTRCLPTEADAAVREIAKYNVADVYEDEGVFTIVCRRIQRAWELSEKRKQSGSKGGSKTDSKREAKPDYDYDNDGLNRVREFARGEGISDSDADWFFWKCVGNGWTNGGEPIRDWKATLRSWKKAKYLPSLKVAARNGQSPQFRKPYKPGPEETPEKKQEREERRFDQLSESEKAEQERLNEIQRQKVQVLTEELRNKFKA